MVKFFENSVFQILLAKCFLDNRRNRTVDTDRIQRLRASEWHRSELSARNFGNTGPRDIDKKQCFLQ